MFKIVIARKNLLILMAWLVSSGAMAAELLNVRFGPDREKTRIVFDISGKTDFSLSADRSGQGRIFVEFGTLSIGADDDVFKAGQGHVAKYGFAKSPDAGARAVIELGKTARIKEAFLLPPSGTIQKHRLVIDVVDSDMDGLIASAPGRYPDLAAVIQEATTANSANQEKTATATIKEPDLPVPSLAPDKDTQKLVIVIDAGHGGVDPGAQGAGGTFEKTVTLAAAKHLSKLLGQRGRYDVVLIRDSDETIRPDKRESLARQASADLFISLHADAIASSKVRGASVYTLSEQGTARSATLAKSQGDYHVYDLDLQEYDPVVSDILFEKAQQMTTTESMRFAEMLIEYLGPKTPMLNRSHRTGDLRVLLAPDVPAVLLEMAFISNPKDEANLKSPVWRDRAMTAVADAIDAYFDDRLLQRHAFRDAVSAQR